LYGDSYLVAFPGSGLSSKLSGFLHKLHVKEERPAEEDDDSDEGAGGKRKAEDEGLEIGQVLESVKVKEINFFDGRPILSIRASVLASQSLSYHNIEVGQYYQATVSKFHPEKKYITLTINSFVKGHLHIEHMADNALKVMPPKFLGIGKELRVRVLSVDPGKRALVFTKKDTLMKDDAPVFSSYKEVKKGQKVIGVVVAEKEHGYVIKTFGDIKGLLTFEDVQSKLSKDYDTSAFKPGSLVKTYVLFKKKGKGLALTLSKKKAKADPVEDEEAKDASSKGKTIETGHVPTEEEVEQLFKTSKLSTLVKASKDTSLVGTVHKFRILENKESDAYYIVKSVSSSKKSKAFAAIVPKCLVTNYKDSISTTHLEDSEFTAEGIVLDLLHSQIPLVSF